MSSNAVHSFDCQVGRDRWAHWWGDAKKDWCCRKSGIGCEFKLKRHDGVVPNHKIVQQFEKRVRLADIGRQVQTIALPLLSVTLCLAMVMMIVQKGIRIWSRPRWTRDLLMETRAPAYVSVGPGGLAPADESLLE
eukprot:CAMPEP_0197941352 /NCGR_PEP_ID=MMETSP1439-20131203/122650_1 /TAXON_ID=66791 /ORGANISM="Gonyaulax spinifera, Strain CCMP409" /LENGTH=134 /DNA_ID=CAMNT_0043564547 /DNA_START=17 /DNA_END=418 /DNA_ORIENTATION=+